MTQKNLTRRDFNRLSLAALGGAVAGTMLAGCSGGDGTDTESDAGSDTGSTDDTTTVAAGGENHLLTEPHVCRGLNTCSGKGTGGDNECAGQGACATAEAHTCHAHNKCKGQGGCGENPGENACGGKGKCGVPLKESAWTKARANFEAAMTKGGKNFGDAPSSG